MKNKRNTQFLIPLMAAAAICAVFFLYSLVLSFVNYKVVRGLLGSPYIGLSNFDRLFSMPQTGAALGQSLLHSMMLSAAGLPLGLLITQVLASLDRSIKAAVAGVCLALALVPELAWMQLMQSVVSATGLREFLIDPMLYPVLLCVAKLLPMTGLCAFGGLCVSLSGGKNPVAGVFVTGLLPALTALLPDLRTDLLFSNLMNQSASETLSTLAYRYSLINVQYSVGGAATVVGMLLSLVIGVGAAYIIGSTADKPLCTPRAALPADKRLAEGLTAAAGVVFASLAVMLVIPRGSAIPNDMMGSSLANTLLCALAAALIGFGVCYAVTHFFRDGSGFGLGLFGMLLLLPGSISAAHYLLARTLGMINTQFPVILSVVSHPVFVALVLVLALCRPDENLLPLCAGGVALASGALCAGDWLGATVYITDMSKAPLGALVRRAALTGEGGPAGGLMLLTGICLVLGGLAAVLIITGIGAAEKTSEE